MSWSIRLVPSLDDGKHGLKRQHNAPLHADVRSHLSGFSAIQPLATSEERWHPRHYYRWIMRVEELLFD